MKIIIGNTIQHTVLNLTPYKHIFEEKLKLRKVKKKLERVKICIFHFCCVIPCLNLFLEFKIFRWTILFESIV